MKIDKSIDKQLKEITKLMLYDRNKTLMEQSMGGMMSPTYMSDPKNIKDLAGFISEHKHILLDIAAIGTLFIPIVGPLISIGLELANSALYYDEGDKYMAGFSLAFALIPMGELIAKIPGVDKIGRDGLASIIKKVRTGKKLSENELEVTRNIIRESNWLKNTSKKIGYSMLKISNKLKQASLYNIVYLMYNYGKKHPIKFSLIKNGLLIGGTWYSYDKLAKVLNISEKESKTTTEPSSEEIIVVTDFDRTWDYKKDGDKYYTKKKGMNKWTLTTGNSEEEIKRKVFDNTQRTKTLTSQEKKKLEQLYLKEKPNIDKLVLSQITTTIDTTADSEYWNEKINEIE